MSDITDVLVVGKADGSYAAKLSYASGSSTWINDGAVDNRRRILVSERGHTVKVTLDPDAVADFRNGVVSDLNGDQPHHRIVGQADVDGSRFVAFFDSAGTRVSLKPASDAGTPAETVSIAAQFAG